VAAKTTIGVLCLALVLGIGLGAGSASGKTKKRPPSQITLDSVTPDGAHGRVSSARGACVGDRTVTLYQEATWTTNQTSVPVATTHTSPSGAWSIDRATYPGLYYATVGPKRIKTTVCRDAGSNPNYF